MKVYLLTYLQVSNFGHDILLCMQETKDSIIALADQLIKTKGFNAFSYKDISDPLEIKNAAIHYHFPAKADLGVAVIAHEIAQFLQKQEKWAALPEDKQLKLLFDTFNKKNREGFICLMGSLSPDYATLPAPMQEKLQEMCGKIIEWASCCLENGRNKKLFHFEGNAYDRALLVISNLLSSLLLSRVMGSKVFLRMTSQLMKDLL